MEKNKTMETLKRRSRQSIRQTKCLSPQCRNWMTRPSIRLPEAESSTACRRLMSTPTIPTTLPDIDSLNAVREPPDGVSITKNVGNGFLCANSSPSRQAAGGAAVYVCGCSACWRPVWSMVYSPV